jgi:Type II secretion system (T2SS), protein G
LNIRSAKIKEVTVALLIVLIVGCKSDTEKARLMLNQATVLIRQGKPDEAQKMLNAVVAKYGDTKEATEANHTLMMFESVKINEAADHANRNALLTTVAIFRLDCGRFPTEQEGLMALLVNPGLDGWKGPYLESHWVGLIGHFAYRLRDEEPEIIVMH